MLPSDIAEANFGPIHYLKGMNDAKAPFPSSLYIEGDPAMLVDVSCSDAKLQYMLKNNLIDLALCTHAHPDHVRCMKLFKDIDIAAPIGEKEAFESIEGFERVVGIEGQDFAPWWKSGVLAMGWAPHPIERPFKPGDVFDTGKTKFEIFPLPGHTAHHPGLYFPDEDIVFITDIDLSGFGPFYGNPSGDIDDFIDSIDSLIELDAGITITSHHKGIIKGSAKKQLLEFRAHFERRDQKILDFIGTGRKVEEVMEQWFINRAFDSVSYRESINSDGPWSGSGVEGLIRYAESAMISKHIKRLVKMGELVGEGDFLARA